MGTEGMAEDDLAIEHVFGNFHDYYTFNPEAERIRFLSPSLRSSLYHAFHKQKRVYYMDIGCNEGKLTKAVHKALKNPQTLAAPTTETTFSVDNICLLNEKLQKHHQNPEYVTIEDGGTGHRKHFIIHVFIANVFFGVGDGVSKKIAKAKAAGQALERLNSIEAAEIPTSATEIPVTEELAKTTTEEPMELYTIGIDVDPVLIDRAQSLVKNDTTLHFEVADVMLGGQLDEICKNHLENSECFDLISCFSITMWIHLNHGDAGLIAFLNLAASKTKHLLIEPQPWKCYKTAIRRLERLNHKIPASFRQIQIKQNVVQVIESHLNDLFPYKTSLGKTNWSRLVLLYSKEPLNSPPKAK
ncbi:double stranded RNA binding [Thraustotheca clavata]|uniref:RNA methyltransferase n=1 Tax=Thraustotheca clavata TaxID=74557 RepID=A0A1V9YNE0_9STRA|nr:double stranded RNA binding [Thraustotheca clavata]